MIWLMTYPKMTPEALGFIPSFLSEQDPRPAAEQMADNYAHGGGWRPTHGFEIDKETLALSYDDDPKLPPLAMTQLRHETIVFYPYDWLLIMQPDGSFEVSRVN